MFNNELIGLKLMLPTRDSGRKGTKISRHGKTFSLLFLIIILQWLINLKILAPTTSFIAIYLIFAKLIWAH
jgi:hypothetical protein